MFCRILTYFASSLWGIQIHFPSNIESVYCSLLELVCCLLLIKEIRQKSNHHGISGWLKLKLPDYQNSPDNSVLFFHIYYIFL